MRKTYLRNIIFTFGFCGLYFILAVFVNKLFKTGAFFNVGLIEGILFIFAFYDLFRYYMYNNQK